MKLDIPAMSADMSKLIPGGIIELISSSSSEEISSSCDVIIRPSDTASFSKSGR
ncbi:MAG: hypothetical protein V9G12_05115 [Microthrixaceae bacterium]